MRLLVFQCFSPPFMGRVVTRVVRASRLRPVLRPPVMVALPPLRPRHSRRGTGRHQHGSERRAHEWRLLALPLLPLPAPSPSLLLAPAPLEASPLLAASSSPASPSLAAASSPAALRSPPSVQAGWRGLVPYGSCVCANPEDAGVCGTRRACLSVHSSPQLAFRGDVGVRRLRQLTPLGHGLFGAGARAVLHSLAGLPVLSWFSSFASPPAFSGRPLPRYHVEVACAEGREQHLCAYEARPEPRPGPHRQVGRHGITLRSFFCC